MAGYQDAIGHSVTAIDPGGCAPARRDHSVNVISQTPARTGCCPRVVVLPRHIQDVLAVLSYCRRAGRHATFRAAGTSLEGPRERDVPSMVRVHELRVDETRGAASRFAALIEARKPCGLSAA